MRYVVIIFSDPNPPGLHGTVEGTYEANFLPTMSYPALAKEVQSFIPSGYFTEDGGQTFQAPPPPPVPEVPILGLELSAVGPNASKAVINGGEITLLEGDSVRCVATLRYKGHVLNGLDGFPDFTHAFRMPVQAVDSEDRPAGPCLMKLANFNKGVAEILFAPPQPYTYLVTNEMVNMRLSEQERMQLSSDLRISVLS